MDGKLIREEEGQEEKQYCFARSNWSYGWIISAKISFAFEFSGRFVGNVDSLGLAYEENIVATGLGLYIAVPLMRAAVEARGNQPLDKAAAVEIIKKCLEVLFYRDCLSYDKVCSHKSNIR